MKICILTHTFPKSRQDTTAFFMHPLVLGLIGVGNEVVVLTPYNTELEVKDFPYRIVSYKYVWPSFLHRLGYSRTLQAGAKLKLETYFLSPFLYFFGILALLRLCRKEKFHLVSSHWILPNGFIAFMASKLLKIPYTVTLPGSDVYVAKKNKLFSQMAVLAANNASAVLADSPGFLDDLLKLGAKIKRRGIIPYPVEVEKLKPGTSGQKKLRQDLNLKEGEIIIMGVARLIYKKGFSYLLKATAPILTENKKIKLIIIGDGDLKEELKNLAKKLGIERGTIFIYRVKREEMINYYNLAGIFVASSIEDKEGNRDDSPVSLFEAMACGKAVVATNFPGIARVVEDGVNGILVPQKDVKRIREALEKLLTSPLLREKMGKESRRIAKLKLSSKKIGGQYARLFQQIV